MKYGMRKPSWKKSLSARTKGRATRAVKPRLRQEGHGMAAPQAQAVQHHLQEDHVQPVRPVQVTGAKGGGITCVPIQTRTSSDFH